jgi:dGTP triphosphohydrolase
MSPHIQAPMKKGEKMIKELFEVYMGKKGPAPRSYSETKDYIAGMTDLFLIHEYEKLILKKIKENPYDLSKM